MISKEVIVGRRLLLVFEPGDDVIPAILAACAMSGFRQAVIPVFLGAFTSVTMIGTGEYVPDPERPLPETVTIGWVEGTATGTVTPDADGGLAVHIISATVHYTAELILEELVGEQLVRRADDKAWGIGTLRQG
jgi:predicted DNA-binding protein with PD1-like motif